MNKIIRYIAIPGVFLFLSQCKVGPNYESQDVEVEAHYQYDSLLTDSIVSIPWQEVFTDPTLQGLITVALEENKDMKVATARIEESRAALGYTKADIAPSIDFQGQAGTSNIIFASMEQTSARNIYFLAPTLSWEIDFWGKFRRANEAARNDLFSLEFSQRVVAMNLISEVASKYFLLLDLQNRLDISEKRAASRTKSRELVEARFKEGTVAEIDLAQAQNQEAIALAMIPQFEREVAKAKNALSVLLGRNPGEIETPQDIYAQSIDVALPPGLPANLLTRRPDLMQAEASLAAQNARIGVATAMRFPSFNLLGVLGLATNTPGNLFNAESVVGTIMGQIGGPIFQFGKNKRRVEVERKRTEAARYNYENTVLTAFREVEDALVSVRTYRDEHAARTYQRTATEKAVELANERYMMGVTSFLEVLESEKWLLTAQLSESETRQLELNSKVLLYKALGGGWDSVKSPIPQQDRESIDYNGDNGQRSSFLDVWEDDEDGF